MELDLDGTIGALLEWDLKLTINGLTKSTRPVSLGDVGLLMKAASDPKSVDFVAILMRLFEGGETELRSWIEGWRPEKMAAAANAILIYLNSVMGKNSPAIAAAVKAAMATAGIVAAAGGSGNSIP